MSRIRINYNPDENSEELKNSPESLKWICDNMGLNFVHELSSLLRWYCHYNQVDNQIIDMIQSNDKDMEIMALEMIYSKYGKS